MKDQARVLRELIKSEYDNDNFQVITITSGKGGVGKTSFTVNLAYALEKLEKRVLILDADLALANVNIMLGEKPEYNLIHVLQGEKSINEIVYISKYGFKYIPASSGIEKLANLSAKEQLYLINSLKDIALNFNFMLIDTSAGISEIVVNFCLSADKTIVITTPEPTSTADAYAISRILLEYKTDMMELGLLVNMVPSVEEAKRIYEGIDRVLRKFTGKGVEFYGYVRKDEKLPLSIKEGFLLLDKNRKTKYSQDVFSFAEFLATGKRKAQKTNFWQKFFNNLIKIKEE